MQALFQRINFPALCKPENSKIKKMPTFDKWYLELVLSNKAI